MTSTVTRLCLARVRGKLRVHLDCGHVLVIDASVDDPAEFDRRRKVTCLVCEWGAQFELGGEA